MSPSDTSKPPTSMWNETSSTIPNPDTYLNHFPPDEAEQFEVTRNIYIAILGAVACDILSYIPEDTRIIRRCNGPTTTICFALVRFLALVQMGLPVAMLTTPIADCKAVMLTLTVFCIITMGTTSFLFLRRVQVIYSGNRPIYWIFSALWAATSSVVVLFIPGQEASHVAGTGYCAVYLGQKYVAITSFMPAVFDTLVFFAISYKIGFQYNRVPGGESSWTSCWFSSRTLPMLSKAILQGGQQYYFATFVLNVFAGAFSFNSLKSSMHQILATIPAVALSACLACRAHRIMVEAYHRDSEGDSEAPKMSAIQFANSTGLHLVVSQHVTTV